MKNSKTKQYTRHHNSAKREKPFFGHGQENDFFLGGRASSTPFFQPKMFSPFALQDKSVTSEIGVISQKTVQRKPAFDSELTANNEEVQRSQEPGHRTLPLQKKLTIGQPSQKKTNPEPGGMENNTGLPDNLKSGIENLSGYSMDDVKVHYNSDQPAQLQAHAYAQGTDIHLASGQEKHLPHEAWHIVQQKQRRVKSTSQMKGNTNVNDDPTLEREADVMGEKALQMKSHDNATLRNNPSRINDNLSLKSEDNPIQRVTYGQVTQEPNDDEVYLYSELIDESFGLPEGQGVGVGDIVSFDLDATGDQAQAGTVNRVTPPTLTRNVVEQRVGNWGDVLWKTNWSLNRRAIATGWVIQDVVAEERNESESGVERKDDCTYQEAWQIQAGQNLTQGFIQATLERQQQIQEALQSGAEEAEIDELPYDDDTGPTYDNDNYEGSYMFRGSARFYEGSQLPADFEEDNEATWAGSLPARLGSEHGDLPLGRASEENHLTLQFEWDPYTEEGKTQVIQLKKEREKMTSNPPRMPYSFDMSLSRITSRQEPQLSGIVQRAVVAGRVRTLSEKPMAPLDNTIQMFRGSLIQDMGDDEVYIYSEEINESFGIPNGVVLNLGDEITFEVVNGTVVAESIQVIPPEVEEAVVYDLALIEASYGGDFSDTAGGTQRTSENTAVFDNVVYHISIDVSDPTLIHVSYYPADDETYERKILHCQFRWNHVMQSFGAPGVIRNIWKPFAGLYGQITAHASTVMATLQGTLRERLS